MRSRKRCSRRRSPARWSRRCRNRRTCRRRSSAIASSRSAEVSTSTGTLPGPTPKAGLPLEYAALTMPAPPVERMTPVRSWRIRALVPSMVALSTHWMMSSGAPASSAALIQDRRRLAGALVGARMRADDDRVARLERDQRLVDRGGRGIGGRQDRRDDAHGHADFDDPLFGQFAEEADGLHAAHAARQPVGVQSRFLTYLSLALP